MSGSTYYVPANSKWPIIASIALFLLATGASGMLNHISSGVGGISFFHFQFFAGALLVVYMMFGWFNNVIRESMAGMYSPQLDRSFRWCMSWFIFSEVMFFAAFFGALFYVRTLALPWLGGEGSKGISNMLWTDFLYEWPLFKTPDNELFPGPKEIIDPWHIPLLNTLLLISSSVTLTFAHKALKVGNRLRLKLWLLATVLLGITFFNCEITSIILLFCSIGGTLSEPGFVDSPPISIIFAPCSIIIKALSTADFVEG